MTERAGALPSARTDSDPLLLDKVGPACSEPVVALSS